MEDDREKMAQILVETLMDYTILKITTTITKNGFYKDVKGNCTYSIIIMKLLEF